MNIGEPKHVREIEPIDVPVPETLPVEEPTNDPGARRKRRHRHEA